MSTRHAHAECQECRRLAAADAEVERLAAADLADLLDERERMGHELAWWAARFPCDGMCSPNDGPQEDCSRHGRAPKDLWGIIARLTAENNAMRAVVEAADAMEAVRLESGAWDRARTTRHIHATTDFRAAVRAWREADHA